MELSAVLCLDPDGGRVRSPIESEAQGQRRTVLKRVQASARPLRSSGPRGRQTDRQTNGGGGIRHHCRVIAVVIVSVIIITSTDLRLLLLNRQQVIVTITN